MTVDPLEQEYDLVDQARQKLMSAIPEAFADGKILWEKLRESLGDMLDDDDETVFEHYGLNWPGKRKAKKVAATPSTLTLTPLKGEGIDEDTTENIFIEGDNLEVLKILYKSYKEKIKMIYIDPPYNTGNDFVYNDDFRMTEDEFMREEGSVDEQGNRLVSNKKTSGRFHANWLNMMYPRLKIARELLKDDGVIFISIDDNEVHNLRLLCDEIFGENNFVAQFLWKKKSTTSNVEGAEVSPQIDYQICYKKSEKAKIQQRIKPKETRSYPNTDTEGKYRTAVIEKKDSGAYKRDTMKFEILGHKPREGKRWQIGEETARALELKNRFYFDGEKIVLKIYDFEDKDTYSAQPNLLDNHGTSDSASQFVNNELFGIPELFDNPKPVELISHFINIASSQADIVLDFFSGSGTTAHAVLQQNAEGNTHRKFICVQLAEETDKKSEAFKSGYKAISEITKDRLRKVSEQIKLKYSASEALGFKVFKTTRSNHKKWGKYTITTAKEADGLFATHQHSLIDGWEYDSVMTEIILTEGFALTSKIETFDSLTTNKTTRISDPAKEYVLYVCLDEQINSSTIKALNMNDNDIFVCLGSAIDDQNLSALHDKGRIRTL